MMTIPAEVLKKGELQKALFLNLCKEYHLPEPIAEYPFALDIGRRWRIDWYFEANDRKVALEIEGGVWTGGRHTRPKGFIGDMAKYNEMSLRGIRLIRIQPKDLRQEKTMRLLQQALFN